MDRLINVLVTITLIEMMIATGMGVTFGVLADVSRNWRLLVRAVLANYVCVPAATAGLLLLFDPHPMVVAGFLILAVCPGAPYGPPFTAIAKGNVAVAIGLMAILSGSSAIIAPVFLRYLLSLLTPEQPLQVDATKIIVTLLATQLVPLCVGVNLRQWRPKLADRLQKSAVLVSKVLNLLVVVLILFAQCHLLQEIRPRGFLGMFVLLIASWAAGYSLGGPASDTRSAMTLTTSLRNVGVGLVIATGSFAGTPAVTAVLAYGILEILGSLLLAISMRRNLTGRAIRSLNTSPSSDK